MALRRTKSSEFFIGTCKKRKKRGMFFTITALLLAGLFLLSVALTSSISHRERASAERARLEAMHDFVQDFERDIDRVLEITGFRAILAVEEYVINNGTFVQNPELAILEALINGSINNESTLLMENATFSQWLAKVEQRASLLSMSIDTGINSLEALQREPWNIDIDLNITINISDSKGTASWIRNHETTVRIPIEGFEDPIYVINSYGLITNIIVKSSITNFVDEETNDTTNLEHHLNNSLYIESADAPSFLMRLSGNLTKDDAGNGIESLVNLNRFNDQGLEIKDRSAVDYLYFSETAHNKHMIKGISDTAEWSWFRLDDGSLARYECSGLVIT